MQIKKPFYKITFEDIDIASEFFDHNQKHLSEFIMATIAYYSGKNVEIKSKLVEKYFKTYKKTMDFIMLSKGYGKKGALLKSENQTDSIQTLEGVVEAPLIETLPTNNKLLNINNKEVSKKNEIQNTCLTFESFWELYDKKIDSKKCKEKFEKVKESDRQKILDTLPLYVKSTPDKQYRKNPSTYINNESWNDTIVVTESKAEPINRLKVNDYPDGFVKKTNMQLLEEHLLQTIEENKLKESKLEDNEPEY